MLLHSTVGKYDMKHGAQASQLSGKKMFCVQFTFWVKSNSDYCFSVGADDFSLTSMNKSAFTKLYYTLQD